MKFERPIKEVWVITQPFNAYRHKGLDLRTKCPQHPDGVGTPIRAIADGIWYKTGLGKTGYGNYVILRHDGGYETRYAHLSQITFKKGWKAIKRGDIIGYSGNTGHSTGSHLHLELLFKGIKYNPLQYIK